jgi:hypothetical protein
MIAAFLATGVAPQSDANLHDPTAFWLAISFALSVGLLVGSLIVVPWILIRLPADYFSPARKPTRFGASAHPLLRILGLTLKNMLGTALILAGIAMLVLPGQGLLTLFVGTMLLDVPGKHRFERFVISRPRILRTVNWLRHRGGRPSLDLGNDDDPRTL